MNQISQPDSPCEHPIISVLTKPKKATRREIARVMRALSVQRMTKITPERRSEIARAAAKARWAKKDAKF